MNAFNQQTKAIVADLFSHFSEDSKELVESTTQLSHLGAQLTDAAKTTQKNTQHIHLQVQEPLERVGKALKTTQKKTDEVTSQLKKTQAALIQANQQISVLRITLNEQQETLTRLNAEVVLRMER